MKRVSANDAVFDIEKLNWINFQYMKKLSPEELLELTLPFIVQAGYISLPLSKEKEDWLKEVVWYLRERLYYGSQVVEQIKMFLKNYLRLPMILI